MYKNTILPFILYSDMSNNNSNVISNSVLNNYNRIASVINIYVPSEKKIGRLYQ